MTSAAAKILTFVYALHGAIPAGNFDVKFVDLFESKQAKGNYCYFSTQYESWRPDAKEFPKPAIGKPLGDWPGENWIDYRNAGVRKLLASRLDRAKAAGCLAVDADNVDGHTVQTGFPLTAANQRDFLSWLSAEAHKRGLKIGLKNSAETAASLASLFDFAVIEECFKYKECERYKAFKTQFRIEYSKKSQALCDRARADGAALIFADLALKKFEVCK